MALSEFKGLAESSAHPGTCQTCKLCINRTIDEGGDEQGECSWQMPATLRKRLNGMANVFTFTPVEMRDGCGAHVPLPEGFEPFVRCI